MVFLTHTSPPAQLALTHESPPNPRRPLGSDSILQRDGPGGKPVEYISASDQFGMVNLAFGFNGCAQCYAHIHQILDVVQHVKHSCVHCEPYRLSTAPISPFFL